MINISVLPPTPTQESQIASTVLAYGAYRDDKSLVGVKYLTLDDNTGTTKLSNHIRSYAYTNLKFQGNTTTILIAFMGFFGVLPGKLCMQKSLFPYPLHGTSGSAMQFSVGGLPRSGHVCEYKHASLVIRLHS